MTVMYMGGTNDGSGWRSELIPMLNIDTKMSLVNEYENFDYILYTITPVLTRFHILEKILKLSKEHSNRFILCILDQDICIDTGCTVKFSDDMINLLRYFEKIILNNNAEVFWSLEMVANYVNDI